MFQTKASELTELGMRELAHLFHQRGNLIRAQCVVQPGELDKIDFAVPPGCDELPEVQDLRKINQTISNLVC